MIVSRLIHVAADGVISLHFMAESHSMYTYAVSSLPVPLSIDIYVASMSWLL